MGPSLEQLVETWRKSPDCDTTIALCEKLAEGGPRQLVGEVGKQASMRHASNAAVLVAVGKMYLHNGKLGDAQGVLVAAGKLAPKKPDTYLWLGEALLRRGDADRALKAFERATTLGHDEKETRQWAERARGYIELQKRAGAAAVAAEIATSEPRRELLSAPRTELGSADFDSVPTGILAAPSLYEPPTMRRTPGPPPVDLQPVRPKVQSSDAEVTVVRTQTLVMDYRPEPRPRSVDPGPVRPPEESLFPEIRPTDEPATVPAARAAPITPLPPRASPLPPAAAPPFAPPPPAAPPRAFAPRAPSQRPPPLNPDTRQVLHALTGAGVFEPAGEQAAAWADAPKPRARFVVRAILLTLLLVCGIAGGVYHLLRKRQAGLYEAADLCRQAESMLFTSLPSDLAAIDAKLSRAFDLSPRDPAAALLWARARTLRIFLLDPKSDGLDTAVARARAVGVREDRIAFARIASYLREDDTESALALVAQWDIRAQNDPYFQLVAGAALERAGDARAAERYRLASSLTPDLVVARVLLARAVLLEIDVSRGLGLATEIQKRWPDRAESAALLALAWARDPNRGPPPPETRAAEARKKDLPPILRAVPLIDTALEAIQNRAIPQARSALTSALAAAGAPSLTSFIGALALRIGDEELARLAASEVERVCPLYPPGRVLTARVALTAGRYDEAEKSTLDLDPTAPEVAMVRAILGFERASPGSLSAATSTVPADLRLLPELYAMTLASSVLRGVPLDRPSLLRLASPENPWGDLVAIDAALDAGDLALAAELLDRTRDAKTRPPHALRVARLLRYQGKAKEADAPGQLAVQALGTPPAIIERMFVLLALDRIDEARALIGKSSAQLGPMAPWLAGYVDSDGPLAREARKKLATLDTPSNEAPFVFRRAVAIVLSHVADRKRAIPLIRSLAQLAPKNPDVLFASQSLP